MGKSLDRSFKLIISLYAVYIFACIVLLIGWIFNIVEIARTVDEPVTTNMFILRCIGVVVAPLGGILGYM